MAGSPLSGLVEGEVHVWSARLDLPTESQAQCASILSEDERARADRFYSRRDRDRYIAGRGQLRILLGKYIDLEPAHFRFSYGRQGKPALISPATPAPFEFNVSHSRDLALYAFCLERRVGVDVEYIRHMPDEDSLARRFFSASESRGLASHSGADKTDLFFRIWTCKEALLKATGSGLTRPMDETEVTFEGTGVAARDSVRLVRVDGDRAGAAAWQVQTFEPAPGFRGALAVEALGWRVIFRQLLIEA